MSRAGLLVLLGAIAAFGTLAWAAAAAAPGPRVQITKWELNTIHNHKRTVQPGAKVTFCAADPYYGISPFFTWSGIPFGALMKLTTSAPRLKAASSASKTFEASGQNADTINAQLYGVAAKSVPAGKYSLSVGAAGARASGSITLVETAHC